MTTTKKTALNDNNYTWSYFAGLVETDGTLKLSLRKNATFNAIVSISQKTNSNLLDRTQSFLKEHEINSTIDDARPNSDRAPALRVQGNKQVLKLLALLETNVGFCPFFSKKLEIS